MLDVIKELHALKVDFTKEPTIKYFICDEFYDGGTMSFAFMNHVFTDGMSWLG